jgi:membrane carboxypeptidase/penicillin-binding protein PbpC
LTTDILSDNEARTPAFGARSFLYFEDSDVAVKTGTTNDYRDAWIIGYTPYIVVGAWAGNNDNSPMEKKVAGFIVAPLWNAFMQEALKESPSETFKKPITDKSTKILKPILRNIWKGGEVYTIDTVSGKLATDSTPEETKEERVVQSVHSILRWVNKSDPRGPTPTSPERDPQFRLWEYPVRKWAHEQGHEDEDASEIIPKELDDIHTGSSKLEIVLSGISNNNKYSHNQRLVIQINNKKNSLKSAKIFINGGLVATVSNQPLEFVFTPEDISTIKPNNTLRVVGYDDVRNSGEANISFTVSGL